jgi:hypothetical protein
VQQKAAAYVILLGLKFKTDIMAMFLGCAVQIWRIPAFALKVLVVFHHHIPFDAE